MWLYACTVKWWEGTSILRAQRAPTQAKGRRLLQNIADHMIFSARWTLHDQARLPVTCRSESDQN